MKNLRTLGSASTLSCTALVGLLATMLGGCASSATPAARSAADREASVERTVCTGNDDEDALAPVLRGESVQNVEPLYREVDGSAQPQVRGVTIAVRARLGTTAESLGRALQCHSARAMLGDVRAAGDDPFFLPASFVTIDARPAGYGYDVEIAGTSSDEGYRILTRANAFAKQVVRAKQELTASR
jgi:hypothetical protein